MSRFLFTSFVFLISAALFAQDVHLSQYYTNQQNLNPALMGNYEGTYRISSNYRNQWREIGGNPITTTMISFDHKFYFGSDEITGGLLVIQDQFSDFGLNTNKILLSGSYQKIINAHKLRGGIQFGLTLKNTDLSGQTFPNQWQYQTGDFDSGIDNGEGNLQESQQFFDINLGLAWSRTYAKYTPTAGISFFHVNQPQDSYFDDKDSKLKMRTVLHGAVRINMRFGIAVAPRFMIMTTNKAQDAMLGGNVYKKLDNPIVKEVHFGVLYRDGFGRNSDAIIPVAGLSYKNFDLGISYDYTVGELRQNSGGKSTYEISLIYTAPAFIPKKMSIPCERY